MNEVKQTELSGPKEIFIGIGEVSGFKFRQISKTNSAFLYEVNTGSTIYYEVFRKHVNHRFGCISYPGSKSFGIWAWTFPNKADALKKFKSISNEQ